MKKQICTWFALTFAVLLGGCVTVTPPPQARVTTEKVFQKNYSIGEERSVYVGETVVKVKDYLLVTSEQPVLSPESSFQVKNARLSYNLFPEQKYRIEAYTEVDGKSHALFPVDGLFRLSVDPDGYVQPGIYIQNATGGFQRHVFSAETIPAGSKMKRVIHKAVAADALYENFEIVYNGTDGKSIFLTYREYTREDVARTAFYQNLTYGIKSGTIRFKKLKILVKSATPEKITYVVEEDGR